MNKSTKKLHRRANDPIRALSIKVTANVMNVTVSYVRNVVNGFVRSPLAEEVLKVYKTKYAELAKTIKNLNDVNNG